MFASDRLVSTYQVIYQVFSPNLALEPPVKGF